MLLFLPFSLLLFLEEGDAVVPVILHRFRHVNDPYNSGRETIRIAPAVVKVVARYLPQYAAFLYLDEASYWLVVVAVRGVLLARHTGV